MRTLIIIVISLLVGAAVGGVLTVGYGAGMGVARGLVIGAQGGVCLAAQTAHEQGLGDAQSLNRLIATAIAKIKAKSAAVPVEAGIEWVQNAEDCTRLVDQLDGIKAPTPAQPGQE